MFAGNLRSAVAGVALLVVACAPRESSTPPTAPASTAPPGVPSPAPPVARPDAPLAKEEPSRERAVPLAAPSPASVFVDPAPPRGWKQCAGFTNTAGNDIGAGFLDECLSTTRLRVRVFDGKEIEEDVFVEGITPRAEWPEHAYLAGARSVIVKATFWGGMEGQPASAFFVGAGGKDACGRAVAESGITFGSGHAERAIIVPDATGYDEYRLSCGKAALPERSIAFYR